MDAVGTDLPGQGDVIVHDQGTPPTLTGRQKLLRDAPAQLIIGAFVPVLDHDGATGQGLFNSIHDAVVRQQLAVGDGVESLPWHPFSH